ncbi:tryptophan--tRNA ligase [candidate division WOR-3 bacterium JGI_Cruoil_03_51_56]|uniref:Tryptophan--tRNA ligase n=1 Tax=candidate division WOR-3 bacterium JGI_Cruoil_03_51_56 TaxID=1973747 RepID=A0A235BW08_UNCW3|nr:MAG: tryptophan--tRNA ligase [candidate division WOR-3 bacterium JGI_Cruoil_03_51_56]
MKKRILTGDRPTGPLHLGHYVGSVANRVKLQHDYDTFIIIADVQALTTNFDHPEKLRQDVLNVAMDNLACGINPDKSTLFVQSMVPEIAELTMFYSMLVNVNQLLHNPTIKTEAAQHHFEEKMPYGFLGYPVSQAADITFCRAHLVPVGEDQLPHIELTRKIVRKFNAMYASVLVEPEAKISHVSRLVGLDGSTKMSKSLNNAIYISDPPDALKRKVEQAVTDPARIHPKDKGHPEVCAVFAYHRAFNPKGTPDIEDRCRKGTIGCVQCKRILIDVLNSFLEPIRPRRADYEKHPDEVWDILKAGSARARTEGARTMDLVRNAIKIDYFPFPEAGKGHF